MRIRGITGCGLLVIALLSAPATADANDDDQTPRRRYMAFRIGADLGFGSIEKQSYYLANLTGLLRIGPVRGDFWVPLRFTTEGFHLREEDWNSAADYTRIVRCARLDVGDYDPAPDRYDPSCDAYDWHEGTHTRVYFNARLWPIQNASFGHESLLFNFRNSLDTYHPVLGLQSELDLRDWGTLEFLADNTLNPRILAARAMFRPLQGIFGENWDETPDDLAIGATLVSDLLAPLHVQSAFGRPLTDDQQNLLYTTTSLTAFNADAHYLYTWRGGDENRHTNTGFFGFADYNRFLEIEDADALHAGAQFVYRESRRYHHYNDQELPGEGVMAPTWEFRAGFEYRFMGSRYLPEYFDSNYVVQSQQFALNRDTQNLLGTRSLTTTKLEYLMSQPGGHVHGFQGYMRVSIPVPIANDEPPSRLPITLFVEDAGGTENAANASISLVAGPFQLDQLIIVGQYLRRNFHGLGEVFNLDGSLIRVVARVFLASEDSHNEFLKNLAVDFQYNRRYFLLPEGQFQITNDAFATIGYVTGN